MQANDTYAWVGGIFEVMDKGQKHLNPTDLEDIQMCNSRAEVLFSYYGAKLVMKKLKFQTVTHLEVTIDTAVLCLSFGH